MRIIAGRWRGRPLVAPVGLATRPTSDRLRGALFSMLEARIGGFDGLVVTDLFAGSGALGLEALSRGAAACTFVERDRAALVALRQNIARFGAPADVQDRAVEAILPAASPADLVLMDPPYASAAAAAALPLLQDRGWIAPAAWIAVETGRGEDAAAPGFTVDAVREHGAGRITLLRPA